MTEVFDLEEQAFFQRIKYEQSVWQAVHDMGGKFRKRIKGALIFHLPDPSEIVRELQEHPREDWVLNGTELVVKT